MTAMPDAAPPEAWHTRHPDAVFDLLDAAPQGLTPAEAASRLTRYGPNELQDRGGTSPLTIIWRQLSAVMVVILIGAALLSLILGKFLEAGAIGAIVVLFTVLGFVQEYRAEQAIAALRRMAVPTVRLRRDGQLADVPARELVPGDVVILEAGNVVPADLRLVESASLRIQEAALTGESEPVDKHVGVLEAGVPLGDRRNLAFSGTQVAYGRGVGVVVGTGMGTELGKIATLLQDVEQEHTPLQQRLDKVGRQLAVVGLVVAILVVIMGALAGESASDLVLTAISVAVAVIPEGLPAVVTFTLAIGAQRMLRRQALIRKLPAVETLGSVTVICSDKTGTLTQNVMTATVVDVAGHRVDLDHLAVGSAPAPVLMTLAAASLCNDSEQAPADGDGADAPWVGDPTETALTVAAQRLGLDVGVLRRTLPRTAERPFDSERKLMSTAHDLTAIPEHSVLAPLAAATGGGPVSFVKGAMDRLIAVSASVWTDEGIVPFDDEWHRRISDANDALAAAGRRVLGVAFRSLPAADSVDEAEEQLVFLGLIGIIDPPRPEVRDAVATCATAGIRPVMITGDHPLTALAIAQDLGISRDDRVLTGADLERLDEAGLTEAVRTTSVFARVSPEHKLRIVQSLRAEGQVVAMTGDGVNDAPALKQADIGVAMGITGTDVSKEAADMVLRDDNFATIVAAVEEGRVIYDNLRRFVKFAVAGNIGKILVMLGWPIPFLLAGSDFEDAVALLPLQLLWLNLMTDGLLGLSMGVEPAERNVMRRPPHAPGASIWSGGLGKEAAWIGTFIGLASLSVGFAYHAADSLKWQTMIFTSLALMQVFQALCSRSSTESLRSLGLRTNPVMLGIVALVVVLQLLALYTPLNDFLDLEPLGLADLALCVGLGVALMVVMEANKYRLRRTASSH
jgi:P-type Ca2+ transporter type 2C